MGVGEIFTEIALTFAEFFTVEITLFQALCYLSLRTHPGVGARTIISNGEMRKLTCKVVLQLVESHTSQLEIEMGQAHRAAEM